MRFSVCDMKSTITGWPLAAAHGNLTPAHTDECAAQCFEGVQRGSIIIPNSESWPPCCHARLQTGLIARLSSYLDGSWRAVCRLVRFGTLSVCLCSAARVFKVHISGCGSAGKGSYQTIRTFPRGCTNSPLQKRGKGDTLLHGLLWVFRLFCLP